MAELVIRTAQPDDFGPVTRLLERLGRPTVTPRNRAAVKDVFNAQLTDPSHLAPRRRDRARSRDRVLLAALPHAAPTTTSHRPGSPTSSSTRANGAAAVARALLGEAERRARDRGCSDVVLESSYNRKEDHLLYVGAGMTDAGKFFRKRVD